MRKKLKDTGGLTFVELLCAVCILVLLCLMMSTCLNMAVNSYRSITAESEAELLVSSLSDALADKLRYCVVTEKTVITGGISTTTYPLSIGEVDLKDSKIIVRVKEKDATGAEVEKEKQLLPDGAYGEDTAYIGTYEVKQVTGKPLVTYDPAANTFTVTFTVTAEKAGISKTAEFTVRCLNPVKKEV